MTEEALDRPKAPKPEFGAYCAALLELSMLGVFGYNRSIVGFVIWIVYFRFSALRSLTGY
jgi:hypothetical protein